MYIGTVDTRLPKLLGKDDLERMIEQVFDGLARWTSRCFAGSA
jgi:hypothetical protein